MQSWAGNGRILIALSAIATLSAGFAGMRAIHGHSSAEPVVQAGAAAPVMGFDERMPSSPAPTPAAPSPEPAPAAEAIGDYEPLAEAAPLSASPSFAENPALAADYDDSALRLKFAARAPAPKTGELPSPAYPSPLRAAQEAAPALAAPDYAHGPQLHAGHLNPEQMLIQDNTDLGNGVMGRDVLVMISPCHIGGHDVHFLVAPSRQAFSLHVRKGIKLVPALAEARNLALSRNSIVFVLRSRIVVQETNEVLGLALPFDPESYEGRPGFDDTNQAVRYAVDQMGAAGKWWLPFK